MPRWNMRQNPAEMTLVLLQMSMIFEEGRALRGWQDEDRNEWFHTNIEVGWRSISDDKIVKVAQYLDINHINRSTGKNKERASLIRDIHTFLFPSRYSNKSYADIVTTRKKAKQLEKSLEKRFGIKIDGLDIP